MSADLSHVFNRMLPQGPSVFGDIMFCVLVMSIVVTICYSAYSVVSRECPVPRVNYGLLAVDLFSSIFVLALHSVSDGASITHFIPAPLDFRLSCCCFALMMIYGFLQFSPESRV